MTRVQLAKLYPVPDFVKDSDAQNIWFETLQVLMDMNADIKPYLRMLGMYCVVSAMAEAAAKDCAENPTVLNGKGKEVPNPKIAMMKGFSIQQRQYADSLGISVKERKRIERMAQKDLGKRGNNKKFSAFIEQATGGGASRN